MNCSDVINLSDDMIDGKLDREQSDAMRRHLVECALCRDHYEQLKKAVQAIQALPNSIDPPVDYWHSIERQLQPRTKNRIVHFSVRRSLALAACMLLAITAMFMWNNARQSRALAQQVVFFHRELKNIESQYNEARSDFTRQINNETSSLKPVPSKEIVSNLLIIDQSIKEIKAALARDSSNIEVLKLCIEAYATNLDLMQRTAGITKRITGESL